MKIKIRDLEKGFLVRTKYADEKKEYFCATWKEVMTRLAEFAENLDMESWE